MENNVIVIATSFDGWRQQCQKCGEEKTVFEIHGIQSKDFEFCRSFCSQHDYGYKYKMSGKQFVAVLRPRETV
jgi:hypothetical protein